MHEELCLRLRRYGQPGDALSRRSHAKSERRGRQARVFKPPHVPWMCNTFVSFVTTGRHRSMVLPDQRRLPRPSLIHAGGRADEPVADLQFRRAVEHEVSSASRHNISKYRFTINLMSADFAVQVC